MNIEKEIYSNVFYGFYESIFNNSDQFIDLEGSEKDTLLSEYPFLNEKDLNVEIDFIDFNRYAFDISKTFGNLYIEKINELLPLDITENEKYLLELKNTSVYFPKYYNYDTDHISIIINTNLYTLNKIKDYVLSLENMENYIYNKNKSFDGFISFLSNDFNEWINKPIENYECNELSFLFDTLINKNKERENLNYECYENIEKLEYTKSIVNYNNTEYSYYNFENKIKNYLNTLKSLYNVVL